MRLGAVVWLAGVWLSVAASIAGFVRPWATVETSALRLPGQLGQAVSVAGLEDLAKPLTDKIGRVTMQFQRGAETISGELLPDLSTIPTGVTGFQIPQLANRQDAKVVLALAEMLTGQRELGAKSYAVYLVPGLALLCGLLLTAVWRARAVCWLIAVLCFGAAGAGFWKLLTTKTDTLLVGIMIGRGLWMSLWAYVGLGVSAIGLAIFGPRAIMRHRRDAHAVPR